ncbi:MAG: C39 family peptidase [bacterium]
MNKKILVLCLYIFSVIVGGAIIGIARYQYINSEVLNNKERVSAPIETAKNPTVSIQPTITTFIEKSLPASADITVPYAAQAPFSNWAVHEESCEEAALLMYHEFLVGTTYPANKIPDAMDDTTLRDMKSWQIKNYGSEADLSMDTLGKFAANYYGLKPVVKKDIGEADIKRALATGSPVLVPVMTHSLQNSMYGPYTVYHILLIKGYDAAGVITNDAGVGNGVNKHYSWDILWQAIDAQTAKMNQSRTMLILSK